MKLELWCIGKTFFSFVKEGEQEFEKRINKYLPFANQVIEVKAKSKAPDVIKNLEGEKILSLLKPTDFLWLLDEKGKSFSSRKFATQLQTKFNDSGYKRIVFLVGGAYGFSDEVYQRANGKLSLSEMTYSHQLIRLIFLEQLYRAFTILNNEPYHND